MSEGYATIECVNGLTTWVNPSVAVNVLMLPLATWSVVVYLVVVVVLAGSSGRDLDRFERRFLGPAVVQQPATHRPWARFRDANLPEARAAWRFQPRLIVVVWVCAALATLGGLYFVLVLFTLFRDVSVVPWSVFALVLASGLPLLATLRFQVWLWRARASTEWEIAVAGVEFERVLTQSVNQDVVMARTARMESMLVRRFRSGRFSRRPVAEQRVWIGLLQPPVRLRAEAAARAHTVEADWAAWGARWLDAVARAFTTREAAMPSNGSDLVVPDHRTTESTLFRLAHWAGVLMGGLGVALLLLAEHPVDLDSLWSGWDTVLGRTSVAVAVVGGALTLLNVGRSAAK